MDELLFYVVIFSIAWIVCNFALGMWDGHLAAKAELQDRLYRKLDEIIHRVKVEEHRGHVYWFDEDDDEFLAQGSSQEEVIAIIKKRFPQHIFFLGKTDVVAASTDWKLSSQKSVTFDNLSV